MATNHFKGKLHEGLFANGEGPVLGQSVSHEEETKGLLNPAESGRHLKAEGGKSSDTLSGMPADKNFDLHSSSYAGPENWQPKSEGEQHPFEINKG